MVTTQQIRNAWAPACRTHAVSLRDAYQALDDVLQAWYYEPRHADTGAFNCRRITGGTGYSLHAYNPGPRFQFWSGAAVTMALAVDINWLSNPYGPKLVTDMPRGMVDDILAIRTNNGHQVWRWGGDYRGNKDAMHYEVICTPADLATGIRPTPKPVPVPEPTPIPDTEDDDMLIVTLRRAKGDASDIYVLHGGKLGHLATMDDVTALVKAGVPQVAKPLSRETSVAWRKAYHA